MADTATTTERRTYWIRFYHGECPMCGKDASYRERVHDSPKPLIERWRHLQLSHSQTYCGCLERGQ